MQNSQNFYLALTFFLLLTFTPTYQDYGDALNPKAVGRNDGFSVAGSIATFSVRLHFFALPSEMKIEVEKALQIYLMEGNLLRYVEAANERRAFCIRRATQYLSSFSCLCRHSVFYGSSRRNFTAH